MFTVVAEIYLLLCNASVECKIR